LKGSESKDPLQGGERQIRITTKRRVTRLKLEKETPKAAKFLGLEISLACILLKKWRFIGFISKVIYFIQVSTFINLGATKNHLLRKNSFVL
jgi:hypothetical protein